MVSPRYGAVVVHLRRTALGTPPAELMDHVGTRVGLPGVLADLNRQASTVRAPSPRIDAAFRWNDDDVGTRWWWPQGITTSADGHADESFDGRAVLLAAWYAKDADGKNRGCRVSVVDLETLRYRHVLVVTPHTGDPGAAPERAVRLRPTSVHAGGLAWWGPSLHIAATRRGVLTARLADITRVDDPAAVGGYRYVLPIQAQYESLGEPGTEPMRYSFLSVDRTGAEPALMAGEYGVGSMTKRLLRFRLDPTGHDLAEDRHGLAVPVGEIMVGVGHMQGVVVAHDRFYLGTSNGRWRRGSVHVGRPGAWRRRRGALPIGPEDLTYWPSTDTLWSQTEYPGSRVVFSIPRERLDR